MKKLFLFAAAAALLAACSSKDDLSTGQQPQQAVATDDGAVGFEAYTGRAATRAGWAGSLTNTTLKGGSGNAEGFGVFGYYTDNNDYDQRATPNFFYNQKVSYQTTPSTGWVYSPLKYWPNEYGDNAISEDADKVTYFAYAPWVNIIPSSGKIERESGESDADYKEREQWGIVGMTSNTTQGDPIIKYIASFRANQSVDLCWGVADNGDGVWPTVEPEKALNINNGNPWINIYRPASTDQKVKFTFKHALAQMRINIDAIFDEDNNTTPSTDDVNAKTRIWVREVKFTGFATKGSLNLNNGDEPSAANTPKWLDFNGQNELVSEAVAVYDGRKDGKEGVAGSVATNEKTLGLNPAIVQDGIYEKTSGTDVYVSAALEVNGVDPAGTGGPSFKRPGVTKSTVNLFAQDATNANGTTNNSLFYVIPTDEDFEIEIVYDVETVSENLAQNLSDGQTKGTSIENRIRKTVTFGGADATTAKRLKAGHSYTLNLHLGMYSVKFDATVNDWIDEQAQDIDLPLNVPAFAAAATMTTPIEVTLPYSGDYTFAITGLNAGEAVNYTAPTTPLANWTCSSPAPADASGVAIETLDTEANPLTVNRKHVEAKWTGATSTKLVNMTFTQKAHPLFLTASASASSNVITLTRHNSSTDVGVEDWGSTTTGWLCAPTTGTPVTVCNANTYIKVWRNGVELDNTALTTTAAGNKFQFSDTGTASTNTITIADTFKSGDAITVELKTGDLPAETVSYRVP